MAPPTNSQLTKLASELVVEPGSKLELRKRSTDDRLGTNKAQALEQLAETKAELDLLQQRLYAEQQRSVLLVLQAMDAAGKDGTIRSILSGLNPQGVRVASFKAPGGPEAQHDYLWRVHAVCPARGELGVFNRSHYEDVLVVRVRELVPQARWKRRYRHIREFERMLVDEGTSIIKCFLHVSKQEQAKRLQERIDDPEKHWKFRAADLDERKVWAKYHRAYEDALSETSTDEAPWYVVPADHNSARNLAVANLLLRTLRELDPKVPPAEPGLDHAVVV